MQQDYWQNKWRLNDIQFHLTEVYTPLIDYFSSLPKGKILVPLCGKSLDMIWLSSQGHDVVGVELSPLACEAFFTENHLPFSIEEKNSFKIYQGEHITIWCGDILQLPNEACSNLTAIYDRAALFALPEEMRQAYVQKIKSLAAASPAPVNLLLITIEFDQNLKAGPPFSLSEKQIKKLYADPHTTIKKLPNAIISGFHQHSKFQNVPIQDCVYWITHLTQIHDRFT